MAATATLDKPLNKDAEASWQHATEAIAWYEKLDPSDAGRTDVAHHALWAAVAHGPAEAADGSSNSSSSRPRTLRQVGYDIYVRAGLIEYLQERAEQSLAFFEKAKPLQPERTFVVQGHIPTGIERLLEVAKSGKFLTPEIVRQGDESAKLILMLADVYHEGREHLKCLSLCSRVVDGIDLPFPSASRRITLAGGLHIRSRLRQSRQRT